MPYERKEIGGLVVEAEDKITSLRIFIDGIRAFNAEVTAISKDAARVTSGAAVNGHKYDLRTRRAINDWLYFKGYRFARFERDNNRTKLIKLRKPQQ